VPGNDLPPVSQQRPSAAITTVTIKDFTFSPSGLTIPKGMTVRWVNEDVTPHQIKGTGFESGVLETGGSYEFTFTEAGTYDYICALHPSMRGEVLVM